MFNMTIFLFKSFDMQTGTKPVGYLVLPTQIPLKEARYSGRLFRIWTNDTFILIYKALINQSLIKKYILQCDL